MRKQHCATTNWLATMGSPHCHRQLQLGGRDSGRLLPAIGHLQLMVMQWTLPGTPQHYSFYCVFIYVHYKRTLTTLAIHKDQLLNSLQHKCRLLLLLMLLLLQIKELLNARGTVKYSTFNSQQHIPHLLIT
jgi:hypothetical protein